MWFVERDANKIGRITTSGAITEFNLPPTTTGDGWVKDLDVDAAGNVWVVWDTGWAVTRFHPSNTAGALTWQFQYPYGEQVRSGPTGTWVTMSYDEDGIAKAVGDTMEWKANAPECDDALGRGRDGLMWCRQFNRLIRVNDAGNGGTAIPLPSDATYPYSVATGPHQRIWFGRDSGGTMFTSPSGGNVGWVTTSNTVRTIRTGSRTAPRSLVTGADGNVWFASVGAAKGIGHVNPNGRGAVAKVGNYEPTSVTYGRDGNIWFTDSDNNSIGRVNRSALWRTNVDVGARSQLAAWPQPAVRTPAKRLRADKARKKAPLRIACAAGKGPCAGRVVVKAGRKKVGTASYTVAAKKARKIQVKLNARARAALSKKRKVAVTVTLKPRHGKKVTKRMTLQR
jgi:virginiamycin B lyase